MNKGRHLGKWVNDTGLPKGRRRNMGRSLADLDRRHRAILRRKVERFEKQLMREEERIYGSA